MNDRADFILGLGFTYLFDIWIIFKDVGYFEIMFPPVCPQKFFLTKTKFFLFKILVTI